MYKSLNSKNTNSMLIQSERDILLKKYKSKIEINYNLNRSVVSFQANKRESFYRWFKYKEGFSKKLVNYFIDKYGSTEGRILDPFAGSGATLFAGRERGWESIGIELLPIGEYVINARLAAEKIKADIFTEQVEKFWKEFDKAINPDKGLNHINITKGAFPKENEVLLNRYLDTIKKIKNTDVKILLKFAAFAVLEEISYTRKDGQYLRWDSRAERMNGNTEFNKGKIYEFIESVERKIQEIKNDISKTAELILFETKENKMKEPKIITGSSLEVLPKLENEYFNLIVTSPPYCNRYDYTRTYALELVFLGEDEEKIKNLRQTMLTCTVENKEKVEKLKSLYEGNNKYDEFDFINNIYFNNPAMQEVNDVLNHLNKLNKLNNSNIPRMVKNYFYEMLFIMFELYRVLKKQGILVMVNDNVRYGGEEIPVDLILSDFAENIGFKINKIWILPTGKGNSSQQMGKHGRSELRKCVYIWEK